MKQAMMFQSLKATVETEKLAAFTQQVIEFQSLKATVETAVVYGAYETQKVSITKSYGGNRRMCKKRVEKY